MSWISRHRVAAAAVVVVGLGALSLSACGKASDDQQADVVVGGIAKDDSAGAVIARASESTTAVGSGRMRMSVEVSGGQMGAGGTFSGSGSFAGDRAELTIDMGQIFEQILPAQASGTPTFVMHEIVDGATVYMKIDSDLPLPGLGSGWIKVDAGAGAAPAGGVGVSSGPNGFLDAMKGAGQSVELVGTDTIDGTAVTVYKGTIDPEAAVAATSPDRVDELKGALDQLGGTSMSFTAWVDGDGLVRKMQFDIVGDRSTGGMNMTMTLELFDLGAPVTIDLPPADQITDGGGLMGLGSNGGGLLGTA